MDQSERFIFKLAQLLQATTSHPYGWLTVIFLIGFVVGLFFLFIGFAFHNPAIAGALIFFGGVMLFVSLGGLTVAGSVQKYQNKLQTDQIIDTNKRKYARLQTIVDQKQTQLIYLKHQLSQTHHDQTAHQLSKQQVKIADQIKSLQQHQISVAQKIWDTEPTMTPDIWYRRAHVKNRAPIIV